MNPITWLFIVAPAAVLAAVLFVWVYQDNSERSEVMREQQKLEALQFDRDFAAAWNGDKIEGPEAEAINAQKQKLERIEQAKKERERERCQKLAALSKDLESTIQGEDVQPTACKDVQ